MPVQAGLAFAALALGGAHEVADCLPFDGHGCGLDGVEVGYGVLVELAFALLGAYAGPLLAVLLVVFPAFGAFLLALQGFALLSGLRLG